MNFEQLIDDVYSSNYDPSQKDLLGQGIIKMWQIHNLNSGGDGSVFYNGKLYKLNEVTSISETPQEAPPQETPPQETPPQETPPQATTEQKPKRGRKPKAQVNQQDLRKKLSEINLDDL